MKLQRLHQGPMSVSEYFKELESQMHRVKIKETNKEKIKIFASHLRLVEKLSLETIPHAKPYKLAWISKEGEIDVNNKS